MREWNPCEHHSFSNRVSNFKLQSVNISSNSPSVCGGRLRKKASRGSRTQAPAAGVRSDRKVSENGERLISVPSLLLKVTGSRTPGLFSSTNSTVPIVPTRCRQKEKDSSDSTNHNGF